MSSQIYLNLIMIGGSQVRGEASDAGYEDQIEIENFGWGMSPRDPKKVSKAVAQAAFAADKLKLTKFYDVASTSLANQLAGRVAFKSAKLTVDHHKQNTGEARKANPMMIIELRDGFIEDINLSVSEGGKSVAVREVLNLSWKEVIVTYHPSTADRTQRQAAVTFNAKID